MGNGVVYTCGECGREFDVFLGIGRMFPRASQEMGERVSGGAFGLEAQRLYEANACAGTSPVLRLYVCDDCGHWENTADASLFVPDESAAGHGVFDGLVTFGEDGHPECIPAMPYEGWRMLWRFQPSCPKCERPMREVDPPPIALRCPFCGSESSKETDFIMWD